MNRLRTGLALAATFTLAAGVAACSSTGEKNDYVDEVNALQTQYASDVTDLGTPTNTKELREVAKKGAELDAQLAEDIAAIDPPDEVAELHEQLVGVLEESAAATAEIEELVSGTNNIQKLTEAATKASETATKTQNEINELIDKINEEL